MTYTHDQACDNQRQPSGVTTVSRGTEVRVARVDPKALFWSVAAAAAVVALSFVSIVLHGLVLRGGW